MNANKVEYHVISVDKRTGERENLDWTYSYEEAVQWCKDYAADDLRAVERGVPVGDYSYEIEEWEWDE